MASRVGRIEIPFTGGFYLSRSRQFSAQECVNWYPNYAENDALNVANLYPTPGIYEQFPRGDDGYSRGAWVMDGVPYFVQGTKLYRINRSLDLSNQENLTKELLGYIPGSGRVRMASSKKQLVVVVPGVDAYIYTVDGAIQKITDPDFRGPVDDVVHLDSVFVFCESGTNTIFHSDLNDGTKYEALDFTSVNQLNVIRGLLVYRNQLYAMGDTATVPYANVGGTEFLFQVIPSAVIDSGLSSSHAKANTRGSFAYLGGGANEELAVWAYAGGNPQKLSTDTIDYFLQNCSAEEVERSYMFRHSQNGAEFLVLTIGSKTLVYDSTSSQKSGTHIWHERMSRIPADNKYANSPYLISNYVERQWRVAALIQAYNRIFVSDIIDDRIGVLDDSSYDEYGINIVRRITTQPFVVGGTRVRVKAMELYMDAGLDERDQVALSWSDDGGYTFCDTLKRSTGAIGEYGRRLIWQRLGAFPNTRVLRFEYSGKNPCAINKLFANTL